jgi:BirA family biotin operon repressor/biotin-[acetyl-CoA-carboxylase] ligase
MKNQIIRLTSTESTNEFAKSIVIPQSEDYVTLILTEEQTAGRGQRGNVWVSEKGKNFTGSFCFSPKCFGIENRFYISKMASLAAIATLNSYKAGFQIKWPNDIYFSGKKIGGILIETTLSGAEISSVTAGVGININQEFFSDHLPLAVSLKMIIKQEVTIDDFTNKFLNTFISYYIMLQENKFFEIDKLYFSKLYLLNIWSKFKDRQRIFNGRIRGTNNDGTLIVQTEAGNFKNYDIKEIEFVS